MVKQGEWNLVNVQSRVIYPGLCRLQAPQNQPGLKHHTPCSWSEQVSQTITHSHRVPCASTAYSLSSTLSIMEMSISHSEKGVAREDQNHANTDQVMSKYLGEKENEWATVSKKSPLNLLDLPVDILKEIIREVNFS